MQQHRHVVGAEAPERVLVTADLAEVEAVAVRAVDLAELPLVDEPTSAAPRRGGTRAGARPSASFPSSRPPPPPVRHRPPTARAASRRSSAFPAFSTRTASSACVGTGVASTIASKLSSSSRSSKTPLSCRGGSTPPGRGPPRRRRSTRNSLVPGRAFEVAGQVGTPVAQADDADRDRVAHPAALAHALPAALAAAAGWPVARALRIASTTSFACPVLRTGLIGIARPVRASSWSPAALRGPPLGHRGLTVHRGSVVAAGLYPQTVEVALQAVGLGMAHHIQVPGGFGGGCDGRERRSSPRPACS